MGGMDSRKLSERTKQPGHDRTFVESERNFIEIAGQVLDRDRFQVVDKPKDLSDVFTEAVGGGRDLGVIPEAAIISRVTGRRFFVEVKKQGNQGNAEERACKHHTVQFYKTLHEKYGYDFHPFVTVMCEALAVNRRYTLKAGYLFEPDNYFLWVDYDTDLLKQYLTSRCIAWLED